MANISISILKDDIYSIVGRESSLIANTDAAYSSLSPEKKQLNEVHGNTDRIAGDLVSEAGNRILKLFVSKQFDVSGTPYEDTSTEIIYRINSGYPSLPQEDVIIWRIKKNILDAIVAFVLSRLYKINGNYNKAVVYENKYNGLTESISADIYRLHD